MKLFRGFFVFLFSLLGVAQSLAQFQVSGDPFFDDVNGNAFWLQTSYPGAPQSNGFVPWKVIEVDSAVFSSNEKVQVYDPYNSNGGVSGKVQQWVMIPAGRIGSDMTYFIINRWYGTYLDSATVNGQVKVKPFNGGLSQRWIFGFGLFSPNRIIVSASSGWVLTTPNGTNGTGLTMAPNNLSNTQAVKIATLVTGNPFQPGDWNYVIPNVIRAADNLSLVICELSGSATGSQNSFLGMRPYTTSTSQHWIGQTTYHPPFTPSPNGEDAFNLYRRFTNLKMAAYDNVLNAGTNVVLRTAEPIPSTVQRWYVVPCRNDSEHMLVHAASGMALMRQSSGNGATVYLSPISADSRQRWAVTAP